MTKQTSITVINAICICAALFITACSNDRDFMEVSDSPPSKINKREYKTRSIEEAKAINMKYGLYGSGTGILDAVQLLTAAGKYYRSGDKYI